MMLIEKDESGNWNLKDVPWGELGPGMMLTKRTWEKLYAALWRLMEYEDTGLEPEDITYGDID